MNGFPHAVEGMEFVNGDVFLSPPVGPVVEYETALTLVIHFHPKEAQGVFLSLGSFSLSLDVFGNHTLCDARLTISTTTSVSCRGGDSFEFPPFPPLVISPDSQLRVENFTGILHRVSLFQGDVGYQEHNLPACKDSMGETFPVFDYDGDRTWMRVVSAPDGVLYHRGEAVSNYPLDVYSLDDISVRGYRGCTWFEFKAVNLDESRPCRFTFCSPIPEETQGPDLLAILLPSILIPVLLLLALLILWARNARVVKPNQRKIWKGPKIDG